MHTTQRAVCIFGLCLFWMFCVWNCVFVWNLCFEWICSLGNVHRHTNVVSEYTDNLTWCTIDFVSEEFSQSKSISFFSRQMDFPKPTLTPKSWISTYRSLKHRVNIVRAHRPWLSVVYCSSMSRKQLKRRTFCETHKACMRLCGWGFSKEAFVSLLLCSHAVRHVFFTYSFANHGLKCAWIAAVEHGAGNFVSVQKVARVPQRIRWIGGDGHAERADRFWGRAQWYVSSLLCCSNPGDFLPRSSFFTLPFFPLYVCLFPFTAWRIHAVVHLFSFVWSMMILNFFFPNVRIYDDIDACRSSRLYGGTRDPPRQYGAQVGHGSCGAFQLVCDASSIVGLSGCYIIHSKSLNVKYRRSSQTFFGQNLSQEIGVVRLSTIFLILLLNRSQAKFHL